MDNVVTKKTLRLPHAYVIFDAWREKNLSKLHKRLNEFAIHSIGRFGEWKYSSMQEAVLDGKCMAEALADPIPLSLSEQAKTKNVREKTL